MRSPQAAPYDNSHRMKPLAWIDHSTSHTKPQVLRPGQARRTTLLNESEPLLAGRYRLEGPLGAVSIPGILNISLDLTDALIRAHRLDSIQHDLKPANVLIVSTLNKAASETLLYLLRAAVRTSEQATAYEPLIDAIADGGFSCQTFLETDFNQLRPIETEESS